eukprot:101992_1
MSSPEIIEHARHQLDFSALTTAWVPTSSRFIVAGQSTNGQGRIDIMDLSQGQSTTLFKERCQPATYYSKVTHSGIKCSTFAASQMEDRHLSTGDFQGFLRICVLLPHASWSSGIWNVWIHRFSQFALMISPLIHWMAAVDLELATDLQKLLLVVQKDVSNYGILVK